MNKQIEVQGTLVRLYTENQKDYICITDIAKRFPAGVSAIESWMRNRNTIEFLGIWEEMKNPTFNSVGFDGIKKEVGLNTTKISVKKWIKETNAVGMRAKAGRYGGTYAHKDIAVQFCFWLSPKFQLYLIQEFERLKKEEDEQRKDKLEWNVNRMLSKVNYRLHTDTIKKELIPPRINNPKQVGGIYANEADLLNLALWGMRAKDWKALNPSKKGNMRDHASTEQLLVLANLENLNAQFIKDGLHFDERLEKLNDAAIYQMYLLIDHPSLKKLK